MPKPANGKRPVPLSLRLTVEERAQLNKDSAGMSLGAYVRACLFDGKKSGPKIKLRTRGCNPIKDRKALAQLLGLLGKSGLAIHMGEMAEAARSGSLVMSPQAEKALTKACKEIEDMRAYLIRALGLSAGDKST